MCRFSRIRKPAAPSPARHPRRTECSLGAGPEDARPGNWLRCGLKARPSEESVWNLFVPFYNGQRFYDG